MSKQKTMKVSEILLLNIFPYVIPLGCILHYGKSKWERVKKMDWQNSTLKGKNSKERTKVWQFCSPSDWIAQF